VSVNLQDSVIKMIRSMNVQWSFARQFEFYQELYPALVRLHGKELLELGRLEFYDKMLERYAGDYVLYAALAVTYEAQLSRAMKFKEGFMDMDFDYYETLLKAIVYYNVTREWNSFASRDLGKN